MLIADNAIIYLPVIFFVQFKNLASCIGGKSFIIDVECYLEGTKCSVMLQKIIYQSELELTYTR